MVRAGLTNLITHVEVAGRQHHHDAGGAQLLSVVGKDLSRKFYELLLTFKIETEPDQGPDP